MNKAQSNKGVIHNRTLHLYLQKCRYPGSLLFHISNFLFCILYLQKTDVTQLRGALVLNWCAAHHSPTEQTAGSRLSSTFFSSQKLILFNIMIPNNNFFNILNPNIDILNFLMPDTDCFQDCDPKYCYLLTFWCLTIILFKVISNIDIFDTTMPKWVFQSSASRSLPDNAKMWLCNNCTRCYI